MKKYSPFLVLVPVVIALSSLGGRLFSVDFLLHPFGLPTAMNPMTAVCFVCAAASFLLYFRNRKNVSALNILSACLALLVTVTGAFKLLIYSGSYMYLTSWMFPKRLVAENMQEHVFRMSLNTAFNFVLAGSALLMGRAKNIRVRNFAGYISLCVLGISSFSFIGLLYHICRDIDVHNYLPLSGQTALSFIFLSLALLLKNGNNKRSK